MHRSFVLCFGLDAALVKTRQKVFQALGYASHAAQNFEEVRRCFSEFAVVDVLVICHTVPDCLCVKATHFAHERVVPARVLVLNKGPYTCDADQDASFDSRQGPERLLKTVASLLTEQGAKRPLATPTTETLDRPERNVWSASRGFDHL